MRTEPSALDWWTFGVTAFGSVATFAAVVVAIVLGIHEVRRFRREVAEREEERQAREARLERAQAEQVAGWLRYTPRSEYAEQQGFYVYADIVNASPSPIYDVLVHVHSATESNVARTVGMIPPGETGHLHLPPESTRPHEAIGAHIVFRDAAERWWERDDEGRLTRHEQNPWPRIDDA
jgi:heme exporter protein D